VAPYRAEHLVVRSPVGCDPRCGRTCRQREGRCMDAVTPAMAWQVLGPLLAPPRREARRRLPSARPWEREPDPVRVNAMAA